MYEITYRPIGIIYSTFKTAQGTPIQPLAATNSSGTVELFEEYTEGLKDLEKFSHIMLFYHFHLIRKAKLTAKPFMDDTEHGIFAIRGPSRPNPIGFSIVRLASIEDNILHIKDVDILDETPLLDIKPYVKEFDYREHSTKGWMENNIHKLPTSRDDGRFLQ